MRKALLIARREYRANVRTKGFILGVVLAPVLMAGSGVAFALLKDRVDTVDKTVAVVDRSGLVADALVDAAENRNRVAVRDPETGASLRPAYHVEVVGPADDAPDEQLLQLSDRVRAGDLHGFLVIGSRVLHPRREDAAAHFAYHAKNPALDEVRGWLSNTVNAELRLRRAQDAGLDETVLEDLFDWIEPEGLGLLSRDTATGGVQPAERKNRLQAILVPLALGMMLLLMVMMGAVPHLNSVMEEKSQRIAEVMLGGIEPFPFMLGKLLGGVGVSLTAAAVYVVAAGIGLRWSGLDEHVPYAMLPWFFAFLVLAIPMYGALFAALGSACNDPSEAQSMMLPAMLPAIFPMFVQMPVILHPDSTFATGLSLVPLFTPLLMLMRMATPTGVPDWQPWVGLLGVAACTALFVWAGGRVFRVGILMQGSPPKLSRILRWAARG